MSAMILSSVRDGFFGVSFIVVIVDGTKQLVNNHMVTTPASQLKYFVFIVVSLSPFSKSCSETLRGQTSLTKQCSPDNSSSWSLK